MTCTTPGTRVGSALGGRLEYSNESVNYALDGRRLDVRVNVRVLPGHEEDWSRVLVSLEDITRQMQDALQVRRSEQYARLV